MNRKLSLLYLIEQYCAGNYDTKNFASQMVKIYYIDRDDSLSEEETEILSPLAHCASYFSPYPDDHKEYKGFTTEADVKKHASEAYQKLLPYYKNEYDNELANGVQIVPEDEAKKLRLEFIAKYVNTNTECYNHIRNIDVEAVVNNQTYVYLRDTLTEEKRHLVSYEKALELLRKRAKNVYIMWDISSRFEKGFENEDEKLLTKHKYTCETVLKTSSQQAAKMIEESNDESKYNCYSDRVLPEDVYVFDEKLSFYFSFTHSFLRWEGNVPKDRMCYSSLDE